MQPDRAVHQDVLRRDAGTDLHSQVVLSIILQGPAREVWLLGEGAHTCCQVLEKCWAAGRNAAPDLIITLAMAKLCHKVHYTVFVILDLP